MIDAIRASFKKGLPDLDWMDDKTRRAADDKVLFIWIPPQPRENKIIWIKLDSRVARGWHKVIQEPILDGAIFRINLVPRALSLDQSNRKQVVGDCRYDLEEAICVVSLSKWNSCKQKSYHLNCS